MTGVKKIALSKEQVEPISEHIYRVWNLEVELREARQSLKDAYAEICEFRPFKTIVRSKLDQLHRAEFVVVGIFKAPEMTSAKGDDGRRYRTLIGRPCLLGSHLNSDGTITRENYNLGTEWTVLKKQWTPKWTNYGDGCTDKPFREKK